jgi:hypothetical protein
MQSLQPSGQSCLKKHRIQHQCTQGKNCRERVALIDNSNSAQLVLQAVERCSMETLQRRYAWPYAV